MLSITTKIESAMRKAANEFVTALKKELNAQGHNNTGKLSNSIVYQIENVLADYVVTFFFEEYGFYIDSGVKPENIPYSGGGLGRGGTSKYIGGLIEYFRTKGLSEKEAKSAAFATATKHKNEGLPTKGSYRYSKNGKRLHFINEAWESVEDRVRQIILTDLLNEIKLIVEAELNFIRL